MAFSVLLYGQAGTGKTVSILTLLKAGQKIRFQGLESNAFNGMQFAKDKWLAEGHKIPEGALAIAKPLQPKRSLADLIKTTDMAVKTPLKTQRAAIDAKKGDYTGFLNAVKSVNNFIDAETGVDYGSSEDWGDDTTLVIDGLTMLSEMIMAHNIGGKVAINQAEWGVAQVVLKNFLRLLTEQLRCNIILVAHPKKETDLAVGGTKIYPASLGAAMDNWLSTIFTDVVYASHKNGKFVWSTDHPQAVTRATYLPMAKELPQDFNQFFKVKKK